MLDTIGKEIGRHRKIHLFDVSIPEQQYFKERETLAAWECFTVVDLGVMQIRVAICFDVRFPELTRIMALRVPRCCFLLR